MEKPKAIFIDKEQIYTQAVAEYNAFCEHIKNDNQTEEYIESRIHRVSGYQILDSLVDDFITVSIATDNTEENSLQGLRVYIDKETLTVSKLVDIFLVNDDYPIEDVDINDKEHIISILTDMETDY